MEGKIIPTPINDEQQQTCLVQQLREENDKLKKDCTTMKTQLDLVQQENLVIQQEQTKSELVIKELQNQVVEMKKTFEQAMQKHDEGHKVLLDELNTLKASLVDLNNKDTQLQQLVTNTVTAPVAAITAAPAPAAPMDVKPPTSTTAITTRASAAAAFAAESSTNNNSTIVYTGTTEITASTNSRSIPAPSKILVDDHKKKDNRLVELRRITKQYMQVDDEEAGLRLYKLQKTMVHVVSDLKKYMKEKQEDVTKSWKSIDISTQRVAFEMVEKEAQQLGVPLHLCIGYWGARRLISKSWANALRTTKKHGRGGRTAPYVHAIAAVDNAISVEAETAGPETTTAMEEVIENKEAVIDQGEQPKEEPTAAAVETNNHADSTTAETPVAPAIATEENAINSTSTTTTIEETVVEESQATVVTEQEQVEEKDGSSDDRIYDTNNEDDNRKHKKLKLA